MLHALVLDRLLAPALGEVQGSQAPLAVLVPPATMGHVAEVAANGETMPVKSTYFYPKLRSGLVFDPLRAT